MIEPKASRPYWPDALEKSSEGTTGLKPWSWALERVEKSHNYWIATTRPGAATRRMNGKLPPVVFTNFSLYPRYQPGA